MSWSITPMSPAGARPSGESEHRSEREPGIPSAGTSPCSSGGSFTPAGQSHQSGGSGGQHNWKLLESSRNVAETSTWETKHHTGRAQIVNTLSPEQRDYRVFIVRLQWATLGVNSLVLTKGFHMLEQLSRWGGGCLTRTGMMKQFAGAGRLQKAG